MRVAVAIIGCFVVAFVTTATAMQELSVWDGVYTPAQADRGSVLYSKSCAACHGADLMGGETAPALTGGQFRTNWDGFTVGDLFERTRVSMPADGPGTLTRQEYADILAFIFFRGEFPPGMRELSSRTEILRQIAFKATKP